MLTKEMTKIIKGISILMMVALHICMFPGHYFDSYLICGKEISSFTNGSLKLCVALFAFLTGYTYYYAKSKSYRYSLRKILQLLKTYWFVLLIIFLPLSALLSGYKPDLSFLYNIFALKNNMVTFAWYVYFYIFAMLVLPIYFSYSELTDRKVKSESAKIILHLAPVLCFYLGFGLIQYLNQYMGIEHFLLNDLQDCLLYFQVIIVGYVFSKYSWIDKIANKIRYKKAAGFLLFVTMPILRNYFGSIAGFSFDVIYAPFMVIGILLIFNNVKESNPISKIIAFLGGISMEIWFIHSAFWSEHLTDKLMSVAYLPKNPILCVIWTVIICIPFALIVKKCVDFFTKIGKKNESQK